jgi:hypothetical protein
MMCPRHERGGEENLFKADAVKEEEEEGRKGGGGERRARVLSLRLGVSVLTRSQRLQSLGFGV